MSVGNARLGDTREQLIQRYGEPVAEVKRGKSIHIGFEKNGLGFYVVLLGGRSVTEQIIKIDGSTFSIPEVEILVSKNSSGKGMVPQDKTDHDSVWFLEKDTGRSAEYVFKTGKLTIQTLEGFKLMTDEEFEKDKEKFKDF